MIRFPLAQASHLAGVKLRLLQVPALQHRLHRIAALLQVTPGLRHAAVGQASTLPEAEWVGQGQGFALHPPVVRIFQGRLMFTELLGTQGLQALQNRALLDGIAKPIRKRFLWSQTHPAKAIWKNHHVLQVVFQEHGFSEALTAGHDTRSPPWILQQLWGPSRGLQHLHFLLR